MLGKLNISLFILFIAIMVINYNMINSESTNKKREKNQVNYNKIKKDSLDICDQVSKNWIWEPNQFFESDKKEKSTINIKY